MREQILNYTIIALDSVICIRYKYGKVKSILLHFLDPSGDHRHLYLY